jgi:hypothetical protein
MNDDLFPKRLIRRDSLVSAGAAAAGLAVTSRSSASGEIAPAARLGSGCHTYELDAEHKSFLYIPDLASRVTILDADDNLAAQLGDGKETDGKTNRPDSQTNPALFAAPHSLSVDSEGNFTSWNGFPRAARASSNTFPLENGFVFA